MTWKVEELWEIVCGVVSVMKNGRKQWRDLYEMEQEDGCKAYIYWVS